MKRSYQLKDKGYVVMDSFAEGKIAILLRYAKK